MKTKREEISVEYAGVHFFIDGYYLPYTAARITADPYYSEPEDGGYLEDYTISIYQDDVLVDITDLLSDDTHEAIMEIADEIARLGMDD